MRAARLYRAAGAALLIGIAAWGVRAAVDLRERRLESEPTPPGLLLADQKVLEAESPYGDGDDLPPARPGLPDIVVIVLDTVRADHLGLYGYPEGTSPQIDAWAAPGADGPAAVYARAQADGPWTLPSHGALFTGLSPGEHGARGVPLGGGDPASALHPEVATVAERLSAVGYRAAAFAANRAFLDRRWGLSRGFSLWLCDQLPQDPRGYPYATGDRITDLALAWLADQRAREPDRPILLFLNYMDAHSPWRPRAGFTAHPDRIRRSLLPGGERYAGAARRLMGDRVLEPEAQAAWIEAYDAGLRYLDQQVGRLLARLPEFGIDPARGDTVALTADHGEYLGEHHLIEHSKDAYQPVLHVPLIVRSPQPPGDPSALIQLSDLARWLVGLAGGEPLTPGLARPGGVAISEVYYSRWKDLRQPRYGQRFKRIRRAFRTGDLVLILGDDGSVEAYDLTADPGQLRPISPLPEWAALLEPRAAGWLRDRVERPVTAPAEADHEQLEALEALGYLQADPPRRGEGDPGEGAQDEEGGDE